jgi:hypothetical protein
VKLTLNIFEKGDDANAKRRPLSHLFGGRIRTSTVILIVAFLAVWWTYDTYRPTPPPKAPAPQVVPPGFVPDPNYTWVPRTRVEEPPATPTPTTTTPSPSPSVPPATTTTSPPPFGLPTPPCLLPPPFCPPSTSTTTPPPQLPLPGAVPTPTSAPSAR